MIPITTKARAVLNLFNTPELRARAVRKSEPWFVSWSDC